MLCTVPVYWASSQQCSQFHYLLCSTLAGGGSLSSTEEPPPAKPRTSLNTPIHLSQAAAPQEQHAGRWRVGEGARSSMRGLLPATVALSPSSQPKKVKLVQLSTDQARNPKACIFTGITLPLCGTHPSHKRSYCIHASAIAVLHSSLVI